MKLLYFILDPARQWKVFSFLIVAYYGGISLALYTFDGTSNFLTCAIVASVSAVSVYAGGFFVKRRKLAIPEQQRPNRLLVAIIGIFFIVLAVIVISTAGRIPLFASLKGAGTQDVVNYRADFLVNRSGWEASLVYFSSLFSQFLFPYLLVKLYYVRAKTFIPFLVIFAAYSLLSTEKALFFRWALPLLVIFLMLSKNGSKKHLRTAKLLLIGSASLLFLNIFISGFAGSGALLSGWQGVTFTNFFSSNFASSISGGSALMFFLWRSFAVPVFTATDSIRVFQDTFNGHVLMGATNGTLAAIFNLPRVMFERQVFAGQWGQSDTGTGSSNAVYFIEAYVNYGWVGVVIFSLIVGYLLAKMGGSRDIGVVVLTPLLTYCLFMSGLLGNLLGGGLIFVLLISWLHMTGGWRKNALPSESSLAVLKNRI